MGLDVTHNAWSGPYSMFMRWRIWLAEQIGIPLELMEGFYSNEEIYSNIFAMLKYAFPKGDEFEIAGIRRLQKQLPLKWEIFKPNPLYILLRHSDCDGYINYSDCDKIAKELKKILDKISNDTNESRSPETVRGIYDGMYNATERFMKGCNLAFKKKEKLVFG